MRAKQLRDRSKCSGGRCRGRGGSHRASPALFGRAAGRKAVLQRPGWAGRASPLVRAGAARFTHPFERCPRQVPHRGQAFSASLPAPVGLNTEPGRVFPALSALRTLSWGVGGIGSHRYPHDAGRALAAWPEPSWNVRTGSADAAKARSVLKSRAGV